MMKFRLIKAALEEILADNAAGRYRVIGHQERMVDAEANLDMSRSIQIFYQRGEFFNSQNMVGPYDHKMFFRVEMNVAKAAEGDIASIDSATDPSQIMAAIGTFQNASRLADDSWDELFEHVFQIIMSPIYLDFKLEPTDENPTGFLVSSRKISEIKKESPLSWGEFVLVSGGFDIECRITEDVVGLVGEQLLTISTQVDIVDDDVEKTGVEVEPETEE